MRFRRANRLVRESCDGSSRPSGREFRLRRIRKAGIWREKVSDAAQRAPLVDRRSRAVAGIYSAIYSAPMMRPWFASVLCLLALATFAAAQDWPQFLGPQRNGSYIGTNIAKTWPAEGPPIRWQRKVGAGFSGPVVIGAKLILFHRVDEKETVECLDAEKGMRLWSSSYPTHYRDDFG